MARAPYIDTGNERLCTGCAACAYACPTQAITMAEDPCGFVYPAVDEDKCISCGRCLRACHMAHSDELKVVSEPRAYGAYVKDRSSLMRSASGGIATAIAQGVISRGGVAYGCVAQREVVRHERLATEADVDRARGSKYVQSDIFGVYPQIASDLEAGVDVVFTGTPCQCAALRSVFGGDEHLLLVDLVCEGVPSRKMYADFLDSLEEDCGEKVTDFRFRDNRGGWSTKNAVVVGEDGRPLDRQPHSYYYYWLFAHALILRGSCYACPYACLNRVGDITVGDFWGVETSGLGYALDELRGGVSCLLVNTALGTKGLGVVQGVLDIRESSPQKIADGNACLRHPSSCDMNLRMRVLTAYSDKGPQGLKNEYTKLFNARERVKAAVVAALPLSARTLLKHLGARHA